VLDFAIIKKDLGFEPEEFIIKLNNKDEDVLNYLNKAEKKHYRVSMNTMVANPNDAPDSFDYQIEYKSIF